MRDFNAVAFDPQPEPPANVLGLAPAQPILVGLLLPAVQAAR